MINGTGSELRDCQNFEIIYGKIELLMFQALRNASFINYGTVFFTSAIRSQL